MDALLMSISERCVRSSKQRGVKLTPFRLSGEWGTNSFLQHLSVRNKESKDEECYASFSFSPPCAYELADQARNELPARGSGNNSYPHPGCVCGSAKLPGECAICSVASGGYLSGEAA